MKEQPSLPALPLIVLTIWTAVLTFCVFAVPEQYVARVAASGVIAALLAVAWRPQ